MDYFSLILRVSHFLMAPHSARICWMLCRYSTGNLLILMECVSFSLYFPLLTLEGLSTICCFGGEGSNKCLSLLASVIAIELGADMQDASAGIKLMLRKIEKIEYQCKSSFFLTLGESSLAIDENTFNLLLANLI